MIHTGLILGVRSANERGSYFVMTFVIGWARISPIYSIIYSINKTETSEQEQKLYEIWQLITKTQQT